MSTWMAGDHGLDGSDPPLRPLMPDVDYERRPVRIQRQRTKGWRMPEGAVYVGRPTRWGNRVTIADLRQANPAGDYVNFAAFAAAAFRAWAEWKQSREIASWLAPLRGRDLACWCPLDQPCHADVLLELANR